jgi:GTPase SAR1 family protein
MCSLVCFSVTSKDSLMHVKEKWYKELCDNCNVKDVSIILVGLKSDMRDSKSVTVEEAEKLCKVEFELVLYNICTGARILRIHRMFGENTTQRSVGI